MPKLKIDFRGLLHLGKLSKGYFLTTIINQAIPFLLLPILTRFLSPEEYGSLALFSFYLALNNTVVGSSMQTVISKNFFNTKKEDLAIIIGNGIIIVAAFSLFTFFLFLIIYPFTASFINIPLLWILLIPPSSFAYVIFYMGLAVMRNSGKVLSFGKFKVGNMVINVSVSLVFIVILLWSWQGRALGIISAYCVSGVLTAIYLYKRGYIHIKISRKILMNVTGLLLNLLPDSFQSIFMARVGIFFMQYYFTKELLGLYTIGFQIAIMLQLLVATLAMSWSPYLYKEISTGKKINKLYLTRLLYALYGILILGALFINGTVDFVLRIMTTQEYYDAARYVPWFTAGFVFFGAYRFIFPILINAEKQKFISRITFANMLIMLALNFSFIKIFGHIGIAYAFCITYLLLFISIIIKAQQVMPLPWLRALKVWK